MHPSLFFRIPRLPAAGVALLLAACGESATEPPEPLSSVYVLVQVQGIRNPLLIGEHTFESGSRQTYVLVYDSLTFETETRGRRSFMVRVETLDSTGPIVPPLFTRVSHSTHITRSRNHVILAYNTRNPIPPDTFELAGPTLIKQGPFGVQCPTCAPLRRVEYVYEAR